MMTTLVLQLVVLMMVMVKEATMMEITMAVNRNSADDNSSRILC